MGVAQRATVWNAFCRPGEASASRSAGRWTAESVAAWLQAHPSVEIVSRDRGTTFADGATRGAPQAIQIADRWHLLHKLAQALEKVLARHHADLKRAFAGQAEPVPIRPGEPEASTQAASLSQTERLRQARREQRLTPFTRVQELSAQGWSGASIARMLGIHRQDCRHIRDR